MANWRSHMETVHFFFVQNGSFSAFWHYKNKERLPRGLDVKWNIPSACLNGSRGEFSIGTHSTKRASEWFWLETQETPQNDPNVHGFQVRTPIRHIIPVSRGCGGGKHESIWQHCVFNPVLKGFLTLNRIKSL